MNTNTAKELLKAIHGLDERIELLKELVAERRATGTPPSEVPAGTKPVRLADALAQGKEFDNAVDVLGHCLGIYPEEGTPNDAEQQAAYACMFALENEKIIEFYDDEKGKQFVRWNKNG